MKVEILVLLCCAAVSFAAEVQNTLANIEPAQIVDYNESLQPLTRKARLIGGLGGIGGIGGVGIVGGIGIVGGGIKGFGGQGSHTIYSFSYYFVPLVNNNQLQTKFNSVSSFIGKECNLRMC